jgi:hypothetical protein
MADKKKPSIYDDGSSSELDEYGEWVTSEPTDVSSNELDDDTLTDLETELGTFEVQPLDEAVDDLEMSFDMLDLPEEEEEFQEELNVEDILAEDDGFADDEVLLDESPEEESGVIEEIDVSDVKEASSIAVDDSSEEPEQSVSLEESAESADIEEEPAKSHDDATEVFIENLLDDSPFDDDEEEIPATQEEKKEFGEPTPSKTPTTVEEIAVVVETSDKVLSDMDESGIEEIPFDADAALFEAGIPFEAIPAEQEETLTEQVPESQEADADLPETGIPFETTVLEEAPAGETPTEQAPESQKTEIAPNLSTELLLRIAEELSSIRKELSSLKQDFLEHRVRRAEAETALTEESQRSEPVEETVPSTEADPVHSGGFFDDNGDEKIALTGDELDNILMSADFTEEAGAEVTDDFEIGTEEEVFGQEESAKVEGQVIDIEKDSEEFQRLREEGIVIPITPPPEDTSLLEPEEILQDEAVAGVNEYLDLSDAVIDEPDLQLIENPVQEPVLEGISFDDSILALGDEAFEESHVEKGLSEEPEVEIPLSEEVPTLEIPKPATEPAVYAEPVPPIEEASPSEPIVEIPSSIRDELKIVLSYMDQLLESLPEEKIEEFASSKYFDIYKKLFAELGIM